MNRQLFFITVLLVFFSSQLVYSQQNRRGKAVNTEVELLELELQKLRDIQDHKIAQLEKLIEILNAKIQAMEQEDELSKLLKEANQLGTQITEKKADISKKFHSGVRNQQGLNPNISVGGDFFAGISSSDHDFINEASDFSYGNNGFHMRELELSFVAPLDPFTRGKVFLSVTEDEIAIEEAYMELLNLPFNMNLKAGIFYAAFGPLNRYHDHALPQFDRPRALVNYFSNGGLSGTGLSADFMLPSILMSDASSLNISAINGGNNVSFNTEGKQHILFVGQWKNYYDLTKNSYLEYCLNSAIGKNDINGQYNSYVNSLGITYKWTPLGREKYRTIDWRTELFYGIYETPTTDIISKGFYSSFQNKLNSRFWTSFRIGYSELPYDNSQKEWDFTACLDFWQSEFVFFRLQYQYNSREIFDMKAFPNIELPSDHSIILQVNWAMGPHKHEAY